MLRYFSNNLFYKAAPVIDVVLVSFLLTWNMFHFFFSVSFVTFEQVNLFWVIFHITMDIEVSL